MSLDPHYYDEYSYDIVLHPDGVDTHILGGAGVSAVPLGKSLKGILMNTPNNFRQFPRQKFYFLLERLTMGILDKTSLFNGAGCLFRTTEFFLELNVPGQYTFHNFTGTAVSSSDSVPEIRPCNAKIPFVVDVLADMTNNEKFSMSGDDYRAQVQIPNIFNQEVKFKIMTKQILPNTLPADHTAVAKQSYNYNLQEYKPLSPVALSFKICVHKTQPGTNDGVFN